MSFSLISLIIGSRRSRKSAPPTCAHESSVSEARVIQVEVAFDHLAVATCHCSGLTGRARSVQAQCESKRSHCYEEGKRRIVCNMYSICDVEYDETRIEHFLEVVTRDPLAARQAPKSPVRPPISAGVRRASCKPVGHPVAKHQVHSFPLRQARLCTLVGLLPRRS